MRPDLAAIALAADDAPCAERPVRPDLSHDARQVERDENQYPPDDRQNSPPRQRDAPRQPFVRSEAPTLLASPRFRVGVPFRQSDLLHLGNGVSSWSLCEIQRHRATLTKRLAMREDSV
jgi:hypothetical protein